VLPWLLEGGLVAAAIGVLLYQGFAILLAYQMPPLRPDPAAAPGRSVGVVVAARDEDDELIATLDALAAQTIPVAEVVVVDGGSSPATRRELERRSPTVRRLEEPPLPAGWVGKNWACWTGARSVRGDWILFLDADVQLHPAAVASMVAWAEREDAAAATIAPRIVALGFWERVVLPFYVQMVLARYRAPRTNLDHSRSALLNGQCWLVRREAYAAVGGHEAVKGQVLEDIALATRFRAAGDRLRLAWAPALASTRMYRDRAEMFEGLVKNIHGVDFSVRQELGFLAVLIGLFWLPLALLPFGWATGSVLLAGLGAFLYVALFGKHVAFARSTGVPAAYGLLFPLAVAFYVAVLVTSLGRGLRRRPVTWKGRAYSIRP